MDFRVIPETYSLVGSDSLTDVWKTALGNVEYKQHHLGIVIRER